MDRRGFLRFLGLGAAAAVAAPIIKPKGFFSFYGTGEVWKPAATDLYASANGSIWLEVWRSSALGWEKVQHQIMPNQSGVVVFKQVPTDARFVRYHIETSGISTGSVTTFIDGSLST